MRMGTYALATVLLGSRLAANAAGDVTVRITDREGHVLPDVRVALTLVESAATRPPRMRFPGALANRTTGLDGRAIFPGLEPGVYAASIASLTDEFLIAPTPPGTDARQGRFTVRDESRLTRPDRPGSRRSGHHRVHQRRPRPPVSSSEPSLGA